MLKYTDPTGMYCDYSDHNDPSSGFDPSQFDYHSNSGSAVKMAVNGSMMHIRRGGFDDAGRPEEAVSANVNASTTPQPTADDALTDLEAVRREGFWQIFHTKPCLLCCRSPLEVTSYRFRTSLGVYLVQIIVALEERDQLMEVLIRLARCMTVATPLRLEEVSVQETIFPAVRL